MMRSERCDTIGLIHQRYRHASWVALEALLGGADFMASLAHCGAFAISAMTASRPETTRAIRSF